MQVCVRPLEANLTHDTELFGRMSPYCKIFLGGQFQRTQPCELGGKNPRWNDTLYFTIPFGTDPVMKVEVMDRDIVDDDIIGYGMYNVGQYLQQRMNTTVGVDLVYKNRHAGRVTVSIEFQGGMMGMGYMGVGMGMAGMGMGGMGPMGPMGGMGGMGPMGPMGPMGGMGGMNPMNNGMGGYGGGWGNGW